MPAEMLGVTAGLGYSILDTCDRLAYDELMTTVIAIGTRGDPAGFARSRLNLAR